MLSRLKGAVRILLRGEPTRKARNPIPALTTKEVAEFKQFFPRDKFFIFGHARSGTTLMMRLVRLHPDVHCNYQAHFFTRRPLLRSLVDTAEAEEWLKRKSNRWNRGGDLSPLVLRAAAEFMMERDAAREGKRIVGDKSPSSTIHGQAVRDLHAIFPEAHLVYMVRDGRDVLVSERFRNFVEESGFLSTQDKRIISDLRKGPALFAHGERSIFTETMIRRAAGGWAANVSEVDAEGRRLFGSRYYALRYEALLQAPFDQMERLWKFLGVKKVPTSLGKRVRAEMRSNPDEEWQAKRSGDLAAFLLKGTAGNWRQLFTERDKQVFKEVAGQALMQWRYEKSTEW